MSFSLTFDSEMYRSHCQSATVVAPASAGAVEQHAEDAPHPGPAILAVLQLVHNSPGLIYLKNKFIDMINKPGFFLCKNKCLFYFFYLKTNLSFIAFR